ncbi:hypothetical protein [Helicobacter sp.]|nr:hypothetical protein [Helicobacter sp.]
MCLLLCYCEASLEAVAIHNNALYKESNNGILKFKGETLDM